MSLRILLADDSVVSQVLILRLLQKRGHTVTLATSGTEVITMLEREAYDVVLLDVHLADLDGIEATRRIRQREREQGGHVPIVAITTQDGGPERERCSEAGVDGFLSRPFQANDLYLAVETAVTMQPFAVFDHKAALVRMEGDRELMSTLAGLFLNRLDGVVATIEQAVRESDFHALERAAHSLRGSAANFSAQETVDAARSLEQMGRDQDLEGAQMGLVTLHAALERLRIALNPLRRR